MAVSILYFMLFASQQFRKDEFHQFCFALYRSFYLRHVRVKDLLDVGHGGFHTGLDGRIGYAAAADPSVEHIGEFVDLPAGFFNSFFVGTLAGVGIHVVAGPQNGGRLFEGVHHGFLVAAKDGLFENRGRVATDTAIESNIAGGACLAHQPGSIAKAHDADFLVGFRLLQKGRGGLEAGRHDVVTVRLDPGDAAVRGKDIKFEKVSVLRAKNGFVVGLVQKDPGESDQISLVGEGITNGPDPVSRPNLRHQRADAEDVRQDQDDSLDRDSGFDDIQGEICLLALYGDALERALWGRGVFLVKVGVAVGHQLRPGTGGAAGG